MYNFSASFMKWLYQYHNKLEISTNIEIERHFETVQWNNSIYELDLSICNINLRTEFQIVLPYRSAEIVCYIGVTKISAEMEKRPAFVNSIFKTRQYFRLSLSFSIETSRPMY